MRHLTTTGAIVCALLLLFLTGCASAPTQPCLMPGANATGENSAAATASGGVRSDSKPETGRIYGAPNPFSGYFRGDADVTTGDYKTQSRQAGAIANPKAWTSNTEASVVAASSPAAVRAAAKQLDLIGAQMAAMEPGSEAWEKAATRAETLLGFMAGQDEAYREQLIRLAPRYERCVLIQTDGSGSSTGEAEPVDPQNAAEFMQGTADVVKRAGEIVNGEFEDSGSTLLEDAPAEPESLPDTPPAGAVPMAPEGAGGGE